MHPVSQVIARNFPRHDTRERGLWINPEPDDCWRLAADGCRSLHLFCQDHGSFRYLQRSGATTGFGAFPDIAEQRYDWIILNLPRQKALLAMLLDCAATLLGDDGKLWLAGENRAGIKSAGKILETRFGKVRKLDSARHCTLFEASDVFGAAVFDPIEYRDQWLLDIGATRMKITSYPGVFAHGRLDTGTALLLEVLQKLTIEGEVLDFACGAGVIGACIAKTHEHASVTLLDNNALALRASQETLDTNQLSGTVLASHGLSELNGIFDWVISNPPVHAGVKTDSGLSVRLLESVHNHLRPGGHLIMVANIHLPYEKWLQKTFRRCRQLANDTHFKVIGAEL
ncbi:MAG: class I SAM-dependent methyltransferase [Xanthomonadales bacterium]|nr:class I SAM-dependent methyltransferase [Xanthomonadales bacterium]